MFLSTTATPSQHNRITKRKGTALTYKPCSGLAGERALLEGAGRAAEARRQALVSCDEEPLKCIAGTILVLIIKLIARAKDLRGIVPLH